MAPYLLLSTHKRRGTYGCHLFSTTKMKKKNVGWRALHLCCEAQHLGEIAPSATAVYGTLLLCGGLFACKRYAPRANLLSQAIAFNDAFFSFALTPPLQLRGREARDRQLEAYPALP